MEEASCIAWPGYLSRCRSRLAEAANRRRHSRSPAMEAPNCLALRRSTCWEMLQTDIPQCVSLILRTPAEPAQFQCRPTVAARSLRRRQADRQEHRRRSPPRAKRASLFLLRGPRWSLGSSPRACLGVLCVEPCRHAPPASIRYDPSMPPDPRANPILLGHETAEATLIEALRTGRMHHAWLITGPDGVGKATLAYRFARRLLAGMPAEDTLALDPADKVFRRVAAGSHADLLTVELAYDEKRKRMRTQIAVDDVRRIGAFMSLTPAEGGWRVAIVDGAEELNPASANALLKVLEEPPAAGRVAAGVRRARPAAADHPQPLPAPAPGAARAGHHAAAAGTVSSRTGRGRARAAGHPGRRLARARAGAGGRAGGCHLPGWWTACWPSCPDWHRPAPMRWPMRWHATRTAFPPSWTCCAWRSPQRCATWCAGGRIRSSHGWSPCVPLMPGATCGTR